MYLGLGPVETNCVAREEGAAVAGPSGGSPGYLPALVLCHPELPQMRRRLPHLRGHAGGEGTGVFHPPPCPRPAAQGVFPKP